MDTPVFRAIKENGEFRIADQDLLDRYTSSLKDGVYTVSVKKIRHNKTQSQLGYYWGVIIPMFADYYGCDDKEAHLVLKSLLLKKKVYSEKLGKTITVIKDLKNLDKNETSKYIDTVIRFLAIKCDIAVPPPNLYGY